jgi:DNA-binding transcriptional regulator YiaG
MSTKLSLREALGRRGKIPAARRSHSDSPAANFILLANAISRPVEVARFLVRSGVSLRKAHEILERISTGARVPVELRGNTPSVIASELKKLGVSALAIKSPNVDIKRIRESQKLSQPEFAILYGLELDTLRNWEQGRNIPDRSTMVLLKVIERCPDAVLEALTD